MSVCFTELIISDFTWQMWLLVTSVSPSPPLPSAVIRGAPPAPPVGRWTDLSSGLELSRPSRWTVRREWWRSTRFTNTLQQEHTQIHTNTKPRAGSSTEQSKHYYTAHIDTTLSSSPIFAPLRDEKLTWPIWLWPTLTSPASDWHYISGPNSEHLHICAFHHFFLCKLINTVIFIIQNNVFFGGFFFVLFFYYLQCRH